MRSSTWFLVTLCICALAVVASAQMPKTLSYQGVYTDTSGTPKPDGVYSFAFRLYTASTGGTPVWTEVKNLSLKKGLFATSLGDVAAFPATLKFNVPLWLGVAVGTNPELAPRIALSSTASSFFADSARIAGTVPDNALTGAKIAAGQVVKSLNGFKDSVTLSAGSNITIGGQGNTIVISATGGGTVGGSGVSGQVAYWNAASTIAADPAMVWDATNHRLGIGIASPQTALDVSGSARATTFSGSGTSLTDVAPPMKVHYGGGTVIVPPTTGAKVWTGLLLTITPKVSGYLELSYRSLYYWRTSAPGECVAGLYVSTSNTAPTANTNLNYGVSHIGPEIAISSSASWCYMPLSYGSVMSVTANTTYYVWFGAFLEVYTTSTYVDMTPPEVLARLYSSTGL